MKTYWTAPGVIDTRIENPDDQMANSILRIVATYYGRTILELKSFERLKVITWPRQVAIFFIRKKTELSVTEIGRKVKKDHSTVVYSLQRVRDLRYIYPYIQSELIEVEKLIGKGNGIKNAFDMSKAEQNILIEQL